MRGFRLESIEIQDLLKLGKMTFYYIGLYLHPSVNKQTNKASVDLQKQLTDVHEDTERASPVMSSQLVTMSWSA